jgi:hypothetical protein
MFTTSILKARKKGTIICKKHSYTFKYLKSKLLKIKAPIQILSSALEKHNYINLAFGTNAKNN